MRKLVVGSFLTLDGVMARGVSSSLMVATCAGFMLLVGMLACLAPTLRGLSIRPVEALKEG